MAFACNHRRAASLQWGDPYDRTIYDVPSNKDRQWKFNFISHRMQSDAAIGSDASDPLAAQAHAEVDVVRMQTLAAGLDHFKARGLADQCFVMWTNNYAEGPSHSFVQRSPHHLGQRRRLPETGSIRRRRRHHEQPPAQHADQRRRSRHAHHGGRFRRRSGRDAGRRQAMTNGGDAPSGCRRVAPIAKTGPKKMSFGGRPARQNSLTTFGSPRQLRRRAVIVARRCGSPHVDEVVAHM